MINKAHIYGLFAVLFLLSACAGHKEKPVEEIFVTQIREDDSKMFAFTLKSERAGRGDKARNKTAAKPGKARKGGRQKGTGKAEGRERENPLAGIVQQRLEQRLSENGYCSAGYIELERYATRGGMTVRGECHDSATANDRQRFPNQMNGEI
ncbi:hypothetical protein [Thalassomonas haliotis]|uniref:Lipoprotein n=1 Tax=Thalassomonas haliotis TaxID=485448 RepID=A0ABY7VHD9_9GAMM|nr:hypothetical protein [Thalassomonas haliotis]WDE12460.1 hypothetical protein H3N35_02965 [Thalassomonas haliotis]